MENWGPIVVVFFAGYVVGWWLTGYLPRRKRPGDDRPEPSNDPEPWA